MGIVDSLGRGGKEDQQWKLDHKWKIPSVTTQIHTIHTRTIGVQEQIEEHVEGKKEDDFDRSKNYHNLLEETGKARSRLNSVEHVAKYAPRRPTH